MANLPGTRIRNNNIFGTISDNPLASGAVSFNSLSLGSLSTVSGNHAIITLDPLRQYGFPEIVMVTAHTGSATVATIQRGMYGTTARTHPQNTFWVHAGVTNDSIEILTSATRPADPYRGQMIFETDSNSFVARDTSDAWQSVVPLGAWVSWTPSLINLTGGTITAKYARIGRTIHFRFRYLLAGAGVGTSPEFTLPFPSADLSLGDEIGTLSLTDIGNAYYPGVALMINASSVRIRTVDASVAKSTSADISSTVPFTWGAGDFITCVGTYEAAS